MRLQELEITSSATSTIHSGKRTIFIMAKSLIVHVELQEAVETYKSKTDSYLRRLEEAEIAKAKASRAEQHGTSV